MILWLQIALSFLSNLWGPLAILYWELSTAAGSEAVYEELAGGSQEQSQCLKLQKGALFLPAQV